MHVQVADLVKADRLQQLNDVCFAVAEERAQRLVNRTHEVRGSTAAAVRHLGACLADFWLLCLKEP